MYFYYSNLLHSRWHFVVLMIANFREWLYTRRMAEQYNVNHYEYKEYLTMPPLRRLCNDFNLCNDDTTATMSLLRYIKDEFTDPERDETWRDAYAERLLVSFREYDLLPGGEVYGDTPKDAADMYRIGFFKSFIPLEANLRSSDNFEEWLPDAFEFIMPTRGAHKPDRCLTDGTIFEETCYVSGHCPVKAILNAVQIELGTPDFSSYDYEVDADKAFRTRMLLSGYLANHSFVSPYHERLIENSFEAKFAAAFPISR